MQTLDIRNFCVCVYISEKYTSIKIISRDKDRDFIKIKRTIIRKTTLINLHAPDEFKNTWSKKKKKSNEGINRQAYNQI